MQKNTQKTFGRWELAQLYFPTVGGRAAWGKFKNLLMEYDELSPLATMSRRTLTPREASTVFSILGEP